MHPQELAARVTRLPVADSPDRFPLEPLAGNIYLSRSAAGEPCLVLTYPPDMRLPAGRQTDGLRLSFHDQFAVTLAGQSAAYRCGVLRCLSEELHPYFYLMASGLLSKADTTVPSALLSYVEEWQHLLLSRRGYTTEEEIGLWGELQLILACDDAQGAVAAWQGPLRKRHDFAANGIDVDVKTSLQGHRHHFRLEQLAPSPSQGRRFIYSIWAVDDPAGGTTVDDLVRLVRALVVDPGPFEKLLLAAHYAAGAERSVRLSSLESLLVRVEDVPSVVAAPGVSQVAFLSDVRPCPAVPSVAAVFAELTRKAGA